MAANDERYLDRWSLALPITCAALTAFFTVYHTIAFIRHLVSRRHSGYELLSDDQSDESDIRLYSDEDGTATEESMAAYSVLWQTSGILIGSLAGLALALTDAVLAVVDGERRMIAEWVMVGVWVNFQPFPMSN